MEMVRDNSDTDDDGDGVLDEQEKEDGTDPTNQTLMAMGLLTETKKKTELILVIQILTGMA